MHGLHMGYLLMMYNVHQSVGLHNYYKYMHTRLYIMYEHNK